MAPVAQTTHESTLIRMYEWVQITHKHIHIPVLLHMCLYVNLRICKDIMRCVRIGPYHGCRKFYLINLITNGKPCRMMIGWVLSWMKVLILIIGYLSLVKYILLASGVNLYYFLLRNTFAKIKLRCVFLKYYIILYVL